MFYTGGLGVDTNMLPYSIQISKRKSKKRKTFRLGGAVPEVPYNDQGQLVSIGRLEEEYSASRFLPVDRAIRSRSNHCLILHFSDGSAVLCDRLQKFMLSNHHWKEAKYLTPDDSFFQVCRDPASAECSGDYRDDEKGFRMDYSRDVQPIRLTETETLPDNRNEFLGIAVDYTRDNVVLANGLVAEGLCLNTRSHDTEWYQ